jgi:hypothetical protein
MTITETTCRVAAAIILMTCAVPALAHTGERGQVLLLPTNLYIIGGALAVGLSAAVLALAPQKKTDHRRRTLVLGTVSRRLAILPSMVVSMVVVLLLLTGLFGNPDPLTNPLPPTLWTLWWVGFTFLTVLAGNLWRVLNPWIGPYRLLLWKNARAPPLTYPENVGCLPALLLFFLFAWFELVYPAPQDPQGLAFAVILYSLVTFAGLALFGPIWLDRGEAFSVFYSFVSRLSAVRWAAHEEPRKIQLSVEIGWPGHWLTREAHLSLSEIAFVLLALSTVSFDGLSRTFAWVGSLGINPLEFPGRSALLLPNTLGLAASYAILAAGYLAAFLLSRRLAGSPIPMRKALGFYVLSIVPIAIGFQFAHYLPNLLLDWQYVFRGLSDPFGKGWDLFGTADFHPSSPMAFDHATVTAIYNIQTAAVVLAHVMAVIAAHRFATSEAASRHQALLAQAPMIGLMILYTIFGLWLLSTPVIG